MWRYYDWRCRWCGDDTEHVIDVPHGTQPPLAIEARCSGCDRLGSMMRLTALPLYLTQKVLHSEIRVYEED